MSIQENGKFRAHAFEAVQSIDKNDLTRYVWFFHKPCAPHLLRTFVSRHVLKLLWLAAAFLMPWVIALASWQVAQSLCLLFVFVIWPLGHILGLIGRHAPGVPPEFRRAIENAGGIFNTGEVLACCFFLIAHPNGLWHSLFEAKNGTAFITWLVFLGDNILDALTLGASSEMNLKWSGVEARGIPGGVVSFAIKALFAATFLDNLLKARRWYRGGEFFTGSHIEASAECRERAEVPGSYVSVVGRIAQRGKIVFNVRALSERYATIYMGWLQARHYLEKPIMTKPGDDTTFGDEATNALGVTHVDVEELRLEGNRDVTPAITVYHTKFVPTDDISAELDFAEAALTLRFGNQRVLFNSLATLRRIPTRGCVNTLVMCEVADLQVVGVRTCALKTV